MNAISLKSHNSFRLNSFCSRLLTPATAGELTEILQQHKNSIILGSGSNVLLASEIKNNIVLTGGLNKITIEGSSLYTQCGVKTMLLSKKASEASLSGLEFLVGIPASLGGAILMNASAHGQAISDDLKYCEVYDKEKNEIVKFDKETCGFGYRTSIFKNCDRYVILGASFELKQTNHPIIEAKMDENIKFRKEKQPSLALPNSGSVFKNPPNDSAGRLLDECGMKGFRLGGAKVWEGHANFIINIDNATSTDISQLMFKMYNSVIEKFGVELEPEILFVGEKNDTEREIWDRLLKRK